MATILVVRLEGRRFAFRVEDVEEVVRAVAVTALPGLPSVVEGVIDYRGRVIPVLSLRRRFGFAERPPALGDRFVIARAAGRTVALRVDEVEEVAEREEGEVAAAEGLWAAGTRVAGVVRLAEGLVLFGALDSFLSQTEALALERAMAAAGEGA